MKIPFFHVITIEWPGFSDDRIGNKRGIIVTRRVDIHKQSRIEEISIVVSVTMFRVEYWARPIITFYWDEKCSLDKFDFEFLKGKVNKAKEVTA